MALAALKADLLFCKSCTRYFRGPGRTCPHDGAPLEEIPNLDVRVGDVLDDRYLVLDRCGHGGMGSVFRALDRHVGTTIALKLLHPQYVRDVQSAERFFREARLIASISHPGVVRLNRFGRTREGVLFIDMEFVQGESLGARLARTGRMRPDEGLSVLEGVLDALSGCHGASVVHCDIKPDNVMLVSAGLRAEVRLLDFGIARRTGDGRDGDGPIIGTPAYMSPELIRGEIVDGRTDLYMVGCLAYELFAGRGPFLDKEAVKLCHAHIGTRPPSLAGLVPPGMLPPGLSALVAALMAKPLEGRPVSSRVVYETVRQMRAAWLGRRVALPRPVRLGAPMGFDPTHALNEARVAASAVQPETAQPRMARLLPFGLKRPAQQPQDDPNTLVMANPNGSLGALDEANRQVPRLSLSPRQGPRRIGQPEADVRRVAILHARFDCEPTTGPAYGPGAVEDVLRSVLGRVLAHVDSDGGRVMQQGGQVVRVAYSFEGDTEASAVAAMEALEAMRAAVERLPEPRLVLRAGLAIESVPATQFASTFGQHTQIDMAAHLAELAPAGELRASASAASALIRRKPRHVGAVVSRATSKPEPIYALPICA